MSHFITIRQCRARRAGRAGPSRLAWAFAAVAMVLSLGPAGRPTTARQDPLPADQVAVVVQQAAPLTSGQIGWRVVRLDARPMTEARPTARSLGFVVPDAGLLVVTEGATRAALPIGPGSALPVGQGEVQTRASPGRDAVPYYGIELVVAVDLTNPATIGRADLLFAGEAFAAPVGERLLTLSRATLTADETAGLPPAAAPVLLLVTAGAATVDDRDTLAAGEAGVYPSDAVLAAGLAGAEVVIAAIGEETTGPAGVFAVETFACPVGMTFQTFEPEACSRADTPLVEWMLIGDRLAAVLDDDDAVSVGATVRWDGLPEGAYFLELTATGFAMGFDDYFIPSSDQVTRQGEWTTRLYRHSAFVRPVAAYVFRAADALPVAGTFAVENFGCQLGMDQQTFEPAYCWADAVPLAEWSLTSDEFAGRLTMADAVVEGGTVTWTGLPDGDYFVELTADRFLYGYGDYVIPSSDQVTRQDARTTRIFHRGGAAGGSIDAYLFLAGGGFLGGEVITLQINNCPAGTLLADLQVQACAEPIGAVEAHLECGDGGIILTLDDAIFDGRTFTWGNLSERQCRLAFANLPAGHDRVVVGGTGDDVMYAAGEEIPLLIQEGGLALTAYLVDAATPNDRDGDGLANASEADLGTDPDAADSDGDGASDFTEVRFASNPLDPGSRPE